MIDDIMTKDDNVISAIVQRLIIPAELFPCDSIVAFFDSHQRLFPEQEMRWHDAI
jgi:hypothetical protein